MALRLIFLLHVSLATICYGSFVLMVIIFVALCFVLYATTIDNVSTL